VLKLNNCIISLNIVVEMDGFFKVIQDDYLIKLDEPEIQELKRAVDILMLRLRELYKTVILVLILWMLWPVVVWRKEPEFARQMRRKPTWSLIISLF